MTKGEALMHHYGLVKEYKPEGTALIEAYREVVIEQNGFDDPQVEALARMIDEGLQNQHFIRIMPDPRGEEA